MTRFIQRRKELKAKYEAFFRGNPDDLPLTLEEKEWIRRRFWRIVKRGNRRVIVRGKFEMLIRTITIKPVNFFKEPLPVVWHSEYVEESKYPFCPVCDEFAYKKTHCIFCGRRFIWTDKNGE